MRELISSLTEAAGNLPDGPRAPVELTNRVDTSNQRGSVVRVASLGKDAEQDDLFTPAVPPSTVPGIWRHSCQTGVLAFGESELLSRSHAC